MSMGKWKRQKKIAQFLSYVKSGFNYICSMGLCVCVCAHASMHMWKKERYESKKTIWEKEKEQEEGSEELNEQGTLHVMNCHNSNKEEENKI